MIEAATVDIPAQCQIALDERSATSTCVVRLQHDGGTVFVMFKHNGGVIGFAGRMSESGLIRVTTVGAGDKAAPTTGSCNVESSTADVSCTASLGSSRVTIRAKARIQY